MDVRCVRWIRRRLTLCHGRHCRRWPPRGGPRGDRGGRGENSPTEQAAEGTCKAGCVRRVYSNYRPKTNKNSHFSGNHLALRRASFAVQLYGVNISPLFLLLIQPGLFSDTPPVVVLGMIRPAPGTMTSPSALSSAEPRRVEPTLCVCVCMSSVCVHAYMRVYMYARMHVVCVCRYEYEYVLCPCACMCNAYDGQCRTSTLGQSVEHTLKHRTFTPLLLPQPLFISQLAVRLYKVRTTW